MGRSPCCSSEGGLQRGPWTAREDTLLINYIQQHGEGHWRALPKKAGLLRCGKSCRLRWMNYLRPDIKRGNITPDEDDLILKLHSLLGNRWSLIAGRLPGRTDNEIKNYWNSHLSKRPNNTGDINGQTSHLPKPLSQAKPSANQEKEEEEEEEGIYEFFSKGSVEESGNDAVLCNGSGSTGGEMMTEVEDEPLLNLNGEDYIQLESFIDYFVV